MPDHPSRPSLFSRTLRECRKLYVSSGELIARNHRELAGGRDQVQLMDDLHRGLVLKVYLTVCEADREWSKAERFLAEVLCHHLWGEWLSGATLGKAMKRASDEAARLEWGTLVGPFAKLPPLHDRVAQVETLVSRLANLVARCDDVLNSEERAALAEIERQVAEALVPQADADRLDDGPQLSDDFWSPSARSSPQQTKPQPQPKPTAKKRTTRPRPSNQRAKRREEPKAPEEPTVEDALAELDGLIGLPGIKHEVRSLTNFLRLQQQREQAGLPQTDISLHMVFTGNPGTGKTTVARIVGRVFQALGVLEKGHLIETDRSGLVAEFAGQTGPKTNKCVDSAMDGLLFIDEAYSLVAEGADDPYGREAAQALLKRSEDDRDRLVVILAGYPEEMQNLLRSNPGLSSRFNRQMHFEDYKPLELARIFGLMCKKNHYELTPQARLKVMLGLAWTHRTRDRHFGNGRTARNLFEHAVRRMANRLASDADIDQQELVTLQAEDIDFPNAPASEFAPLAEGAAEVRITCPDCEHQSRAPVDFLGRKVRCPKCEKRFTAEWGEVSASE